MIRRPTSATIARYAATILANGCGFEARYACTLASDCSAVMRRAFIRSRTEFSLTAGVLISAPSAAVVTADACDGRWRRLGGNRLSGCGRLRRERLLDLVLHHREEQKREDA